MEVHWKNLLALSISFTILLCSTNTAQAAQSTLNMASGLGLASLSCVYIFCGISCFFSKPFVQFFGSKWTVVICEFGYCTFHVANLYPTFYTLIPCSIIYGSCAGPLYTAQGTYLTSIAISYASKTKRNKEHTIEYFTGVFFMFYLLGTSPGMLILSFLLQNNKDTDNSENILNSVKFCGAKDNCRNGHFLVFDNASLSHGNYNMPGSDAVIKLFSTLLAFGVSSALIAIFFVDRLHTFSTHVQEKTKRTNIFSVASSMKFLLLVPMIVLYSFENVLFFGDFTKSFTGCTLGVAQVGFTSAIYFFSGGIAAVVVGYLVKWTGRIPILTTAWVVQLSQLIYMLLWRPESAMGCELYVLSVVFGMGTGLREAQTLSLLGILFEDDLEAANSALRFVWGTVIGIGFAVGTANICVAYKIWFTLLWCTFTMAVYFWLEIKIRKGHFDNNRQPEQGLENIPEKKCLTSGTEDGMMSPGDHRKAVKLIERETSV